MVITFRHLFSSPVNLCLSNGLEFRNLTTLLFNHLRSDPDGVLPKVSWLLCINSIQERLSGSWLNYLSILLLPDLWVVNFLNGIIARLVYQRLLLFIIIYYYLLLFIIIYYYYFLVDMKT